MLNFVTTSVNKIECFTNIWPSMPTSADCLPTKVMSIKARGIVGDSAHARFV